MLDREKQSREGGNGMRSGERPEGGWRGMARESV